MLSYAKQYGPEPEGIGPDGQRYSRPVGPLRPDDSCYIAVLCTAMQCSADIWPFRPYGWAIIRAVPAYCVAFATGPLGPGALA